MPLTPAQSALLDQLRQPHTDGLPPGAVGRLNGLLRFGDPTLAEAAAIRALLHPDPADVTEPDPNRGAAGLAEARRRGYLDQEATP